MDAGVIKTRKFQWTVNIYSKMKLLEYFTHFLYYKAVWKLYPSFWENWSRKQQVTQCHVLVSRSKMELQFRAFDYKSHVFLLTSTALLGVDVNSWLHCTLLLLCSVQFSFVELLCSLIFLPQWAQVMSTLSGKQREEGGQRTAAGRTITHDALRIQKEQSPKT